MEIANGEKIQILANFIANNNVSQRFLLKIQRDSNNVSTGTLLSKDEDLHFFENLAMVMRNATSISEIVRNLRIEQGEDARIKTREFISSVQLQFEDVGIERLIFLSEEFDVLHFQYRDAAVRLHILNVELLKDVVPIVVENVSVDLPEKFNFEQNDSLRTLYDKFVDTVDAYQDFWEELAELESSEMILKSDDDDKSLASTTRRLILDNGVWVRLTLNPKHPRCLPEFVLIGSDDAVVSFKTRIDSKLDKWNEDNSLVENLYSIFGCKTSEIGPTQRLRTSETKCMICYSFESTKSEVPDQNCQHCIQQYHQSCLYEWLRKQPTQKLSFGTVFGPCPYCRQNIKLKLSSII